MLRWIGMCCSATTEHLAFVYVGCRGLFDGDAQYPFLRKKLMFLQPSFYCASPCCPCVFCCLKTQFGGFDSFAFRLCNGQQLVAAFYLVKRTLRVRVSVIIVCTRVLVCLGP